MSETAIRIQNLVKRFPNFQLGPLDLSVPKGAIYGLIGPNGAGKTTTIDLMLNIGMEAQGSIHIFDMDRRAYEVAVKQRIGYVSPDLNYNAWGKVNRLVHFIRKYYPTWDQDYCQSLLERFGIGWRESIASLSFGNRIKLALVMALSHRPELLLLDEPTLGVDAVSKKQIFSELLAAVQDEYHTVLISSHGLADIERFADHIGIIQNGRMLLEGSTADLLERFCFVDFHTTNGIVPTVKGLILQEREGNRCRALFDQQSPVEDLATVEGIRNVNYTPVTLEELFVGLVQEG